MASYKKYAEDLIGNWETGQYEPQRNVTRNVYQTNITKLANDFGALKDKLARNFANAQTEYANTLNDVQNQSFNRMRNAEIDLANRGLSTSGVGALATQADTQRKGEDIDRALSNLLDVNKATIEGLTSGVMNLGQKQSSLAGDLAGDLGGITDKEAQNAQQYANLIAGIGEGAASRAASRARSGGGSSKKTKAEKENDEIKRRILIADTLASTELTDDQKKQYLNTYLDVPGDVAVSAVEGYNNNNKLASNRAALNRAQTNLDRQNSYLDTWNKVTSNPIVNVLNPSSLLYRYVLNYPNAGRINAENEVRRAQNELNNLTYTDLAELLYGKK